MKLIYIIMAYVLAMALVVAWIFAQWVPIVVQLFQRTNGA